MTPNPPQLEPAIHDLLDGLRRRIRRYVWVEGLAAAVAWLGLAFWVSLAVDWLFEPPPAVRAVVLGVLLGGLAAVVYHLIVRRVVVPLRDRSMALLLEKYFPEFEDRLVTAVELGERRPGEDEANPAMLARTTEQAVAPVSHVQFHRVFNPWPLGRSVGLAVVLFAAIGVFAALTLGPASEWPIAVWARRTLMFSDELWPRKTGLSVEGFENGVAKIARGSDFDVVARADLAMPEVPDWVEVRYRTEGGARDRRPMNREGQADPAKDQYQEYSYKFRSVLAPVTFDVFGGDAAVRGLRIDVVENPAIVRLLVECEYPKYMGRRRVTAPASGLMQFPIGAKLVVRAKTNKDLVRVAVDSALEQPPKPARSIQPDEDDARTFHFEVPRLAKDTTLLFTLFDADGIKSREPIRLALAALEDKPPEFSVQLQGIGPAITSQASIPVSGRVTDDNGLAHVWFEYAIDKAKTARQAILSSKENATEAPLAAALDVRPLELKPGQKFQLCLKAEDRYDLGADPHAGNVGQSERWLLDVVTPEQLRSMLQARELVLRQRFEAVIQDVVDTRDLLARIDFDAKPPAASKGNEPGEKAKQFDNSPQRLLAQRMLRVQSAMQNSRKDASEVLGVAQAFQDIRAELVNNRIDTAELKERIENGIANPLRRVGGEMFPELDRRLDALQAALDNPKTGREGLQRAVVQVDAILVAMRQALARMIELEDFNEAVELLRSIIQSQEKLNDLTKQRHKQKLRDLLEK